MAEPRERDRDATKARLIRAVEELIALDGFGVVGINAVARRAGADKVLIYRYFGGLAALLAAYAEEGDFWWRVDDLLAEPLPGPADEEGRVDDLLAEPLPGPADEEGLPACLATVFARHAAFLRDHPVTLEVIAWEMSERNELTQGLESVRESRSQAMMCRLAARFAIEEGAFLREVGPMFALLGAAANYLSARGRRLGTFNGIDLQSDEGWETLQKSAARMIAGVHQAGLADFTNP